MAYTQTLNSHPLPESWLADQARKRPAAPALSVAGETLAYGELAARVAGLGAGLRAAGVGPGELLAWPVQSAYRTALLVHATAALDCALFPLNPDLPASRLESLLQQAGVDGWLGQGPPPLPGLRRLDLGALSAADPLAAGKPAAADPAVVRLVIATSGSSGEPKAVMLSAASLAAGVHASRQRLPLGPDDRWLCCLPLYHIGALAILYRCAEAGAAAIVHEGFDSAQVLGDLERQAVTHLSLVPAMLARLLEASGGRPPPAALRTVLIGGAALSPDLAQRALEAGWPLCVSYGLSEAGSQVATHCLAAGEAVVQGVVGQPLDGMEVAIRDRAGKPTQGPGRIWLRGPALMAGYANPQRRPGDGLQAGWFESGDLGRFDGEGRLTVEGRADAMLVSGGENVHPAQVEVLLERCPGVREAGVGGRADPVWGERVVAVVVGSVTPAELERWARDKLRGAMRPREFIQAAALPRTANGKLDRVRLRQLLADQPAE